MARKLIPGVYRITNTVTGDCYVGSSKHVYDRWHEHRYLLRKGIHINKHLQASWNKHGESAFAHDVLEECALDVVIECEQHWIDTLSPVYNNRKTAAWVDRNRKDSPETVARKSNRKPTPDQLDALAKGWKREHGKHSPETIAIIKEKRSKQVMSPAQIEAFAKGRQKRLDHPDLYGKPRQGMKNSEEHNRKIAEAHTGMKSTDEANEKNRLAKLGKKQSPELIRKRSEGMQGHTVSEQARLKSAATNRATWAKKTAEEKHAITQKRPPVSEATRQKQSEAAKHRHHKTV